MLTTKKRRLSICSADEEMNIEILERETLKWGETKIFKNGVCTEKGETKIL